MKQINIKYNVGDKINRTIKCFATVSHSGSSTEQTLRIQRIIIERGNSFNGWKPTFYYECQDEQNGNFVTLNDEEINECSSTEHLSNNNQLSEDKIEKLNKLTDLFEKTFDWGCNDTASDLYAYAVYAVISGNEIYEECIDKFKIHMLENLR